MDNCLTNNTYTPSVFTGSTLVWCLLMPSIHFLSLLSNIFCIIVFCSNTFIHKPIAIYFICLLISDSTTLLIGYSEMLDRQSDMVEKSSLLCTLNEKIIHNLTDFVYSFMGKFCLEWMLYKVLWTRASTILLAILSIQRSRTFFSLSYRETRFCAVLACITSVLIALFITCFEWMGVQCGKSTDPYVYMEIFQLVMDNKQAKEFYSNFLYDRYDELIDKYYCIFQTLNINRGNSSMSRVNQSHCSITRSSSEFYSLTKSLVASRDAQISESIANLLPTIYDCNSNLSNTSVLFEHFQKKTLADVFIELFEDRLCQVTLMYSVYFKLYDFLHSLSFTFNRHMMAIFFGNALPSFIVFLANLFSLKVIYFSPNLKYLKRTKGNNHHRRRLQNDIRALLVILIESFSIITISWGIPIFLTMFYCHTLYVVSIAQCPQIKDSLALFLFTDLFNSSTNCLLYSLSGKLFRHKFISMIKVVFTCGRCISRNVKTPPLNSPSQQLERQASDEPPVNCAMNSRRRSNPHTEVVSPKPLKKSKHFSKHQQTLESRGSLSIPNIGDENQEEFVRQIDSTDKFRRPKTIKSFFLSKVHWFGSTKKYQTELTVNYRTRTRTIN
ncbi:unnamed protein product [Rotaria socialis]|uniref:Uncharacterized protein n=1 Tax=Rotaria socialis TaxID=392032 RepID=A0A818TFN1_9BILA|nr:unnamed protein product [Rotaria socialis]CAF3385025.1 unnamed protein product [Rotaria socialis]CAF3395612.1 unnamed protein product [Rotaria socialis]CAF3516350.1 unnamed protein product [Rotaria socialis]CAF3686345.1 unnamed protein product [Rotaria socialis]